MAAVPELQRGRNERTEGVGVTALAVDVARANLIREGFSDLADQTVGNRAGMPMTVQPMRECGSLDQVRAIVRSFVLGHQADGHDARYVDEWDGKPAVKCATCEARIEAEAQQRGG